MDYPVKKGQKLTVDIARQGDAGRGVAVVEGLTVLVDQALAGERVLAEITRVQPRYALARTLRVERPAACRVTPPCPHYAQCGGCSMQLMDYDAHLAALSGQVGELLRRVGGARGVEMLPPLPARQPWRYRNKAAFRAGGTAERPALGFVSRGTHDVVPAADCLLQTGEACAAARAVEGWMAAHRVAPYDERTRRGVLRHLVVRTNRRGETLVTPVSAVRRIPAQQELIAALRAALPGLRGVALNVNPRPTQEILGRETRVLFGEERLEEEMLGRRFLLSPLSFFQVNTPQAENLYRQALEFAELTGAETVLDAYCGAGTITLALAARAARVVGVEIVPEAVRDARDNAARNGVTNVEFHCGACEEVAPRLTAEGFRPDVALLDPPRRGCDEAVLRAVAGSGPRRIVYVSCSPATLARDAGRLQALDYRAVRARAVDLFPWTGEVETAALFLPEQEQ